MPLFFLPWTNEFFEFNKQYLLWLIMPLAGVLWAVKVFGPDKRLVLKRTPLDIPILIFLLVVLLSSLAGIDKFSSLAGFDGVFSAAWLGLLSLVLFYFALVNFFPARKIFSLLDVFFYSHALVLILALMSFPGWPARLAGGFFPGAVFNTVSGSWEIFALYDVVAIILLFGRLFFNEGGNVLGKLTLPAGRSWFLGIILFFSFLLLFFLNFSLAWISLLFAGLLFGLFELGRKKRFSRRLVWPGLLVVAAAVFWLLPSLSVRVNNYLPGEKLFYPTPGYSESIRTARASLGDNLILGSGPGTFAYDFSRYRGSDFNRREFWYLRFDQAGSYLIELAATLGIAGLLSYFLILSLAFYLIFVFTNRLSAKEDGQGRVAILAIAWSVVVLGQFLYASSTVLLFMFWFILGMLLIAGREIQPAIFASREIKLAGNRFRPVLAGGLLCLCLGGGAALANFEAKYWLADFYVRQGGETNLIRAISLNPYRYNYQVELAQYYLDKVKSEVNQAAALRDDALIEENIKRAVRWARAAAATQPNSVVCQETLGMVYRDVRALTRGSDPWAIRAFAEASRLEPSNPVLLTELGKAYLNAGLSAEAEAAFNQALAAKDDYYEADFGLARVLSRNGHEPAALEMLAELVRVYPTEDVFYELGRLYYNQGKTKEAIDNFSRVVAANPNHVNGLYSLGLALELEGEEEQALEYLWQARQLDPGNGEIVGKIEELETRHEKNE